MNVSKASSSNMGERQSWIKYANKVCHCNKIAAIKVSMTNENPNRLFYVCKNNNKKNKSKQRCEFFKWCEPIGCEKDSTQVLESKLTDFGSKNSTLEHELECVLVDQAMKFDALNKELDAKLVDMKHLIEEDIQHVKIQSEIELLFLQKQFEECNQQLLEIKREVRNESLHVHKRLMDDIVFVKKNHCYELSILKEDLRKAKYSMCKIKCLIVVLVLVLGSLAFITN
jgi:hypothetical protein